LSNLPSGQIFISFHAAMQACAGEDFAVRQKNVFQFSLAETLFPPALDCFHCCVFNLRCRSVF
jgi:hypothetical protein